MWVESTKPDSDTAPSSVGFAHAGTAVRVQSGLRCFWAHDWLMGQKRTPIRDDDPHNKSQ